MSGPWEKYGGSPDGGPWARYAPTPAPQDDSPANALSLGALKPVDNLVRGARATLPAGVVDTIDNVGEALGMPRSDEAVEANQRARANNTRKGWQDAGKFAGTLPTLAIPGGWLPQGAAGGALLSDADTAEGLAIDTGVGIAGSGIGTGAVKGLGWLASPTVREPVKELIRRKIPVTVGQAVGGAVQRVEDALTSTFGVGHQILARQGEGVKAFNRAAIDEVLAPFGLKLPEGVSGHNAIKYVKDSFKTAYDSILGNMVVPDDSALRGAVRNLTQTAATIPGDLSKTFQAFVAKEVTPYFKNGVMDGRYFKEVDRVLRKEAQRYANGKGAEQAYADLLSGLRGELRSAAGRGSNPVLVKALQETDNAYANYVPIRDAASKTADGSFLPGGLDVSVRVADKSAGKGAKAAGEARMQTLSSSARQVLPPTLGNSGTPDRLVANGLMAGGVGLGTAVTPWALAVPPLLAALYTKGGQKAAQWALTGRQGPGAQAVRRGLFGAARLAPAAVPPLLVRPQE